MKYFLDFGTHYFSVWGNGILSFEERGYFGSGSTYDWHVLTFEPSPHAFEANVRHLLPIGSRFASFKAYKAAISDYSGFIDFKWCPRNESGSNCIDQNVAEIPEDGAIIYKVPALSVESLIKEIAVKDSNASITIKCDIEGSEFTVLPALLKIADVQQWVKEIYVEWHERFWLGKSEYEKILSTKEGIKAQCKKQGIVLADMAIVGGYIQELACTA